MNRSGGHSALRRPWAPGTGGHETHRKALACGLNPQRDKWRSATLVDQDSDMGPEELSARWADDASQWTLALEELEHSIW